jgi:hypothetical protein
MPKDDVTRRPHVLLVDVTQAASKVSRLMHEARDVNLPVEPVSARAATPWSAGLSCRGADSVMPDGSLALLLAPAMGDRTPPVATTTGAFALFTPACHDPCRSGAQGSSSAAG